MHSYPEETLDEDNDDGTIVDNVDKLRTAVVGHRIVKTEMRNAPDQWGH